MAILAMSRMGVPPMQLKAHGEDTGKMPVVLMGETPMLRTVCHVRFKAASSMSISQIPMNGTISPPTP